MSVLAKRSHIIVVGSGIAGLIASIELARHHRVTLVTKSRLSESNTRYAQGGIAAAMFPDDSVQEHVEDTLRAGAGLNCRATVEILCAEGPARIRDLIRLGVGFDQHNGQLARGMEAAHSHARVLHAGGDATGFAIESALIRAIRTANIEVLEHTFACDLILEDGRVAGLEVLDEQENLRHIEADAVLLASGGAGQLFLHTTNPAVATGDGVALALRAGAQVADVEFYQFHPTALAIEGNFLISEAVRGDGAVLRDLNGYRFMQDVHPGAELAPRDVVSRGIAAQMLKQQGQPVLLDATALGKSFLSERFPTIDAACRAHGLDWSRTPIPVTPAAHYWMGGIRTDAFGRTSLPSLYAVGETACTGVHGANRLASNSLLESLVFAWRCAALLNGEPAPAPTHLDTCCFNPAASSEEAFLAPFGDLSQQSPTAVPFTRTQLQTLMWTHAGIVRNAEGLAEAAHQLRHWRAEGSSVEARENANLLTLARVLVAAATAREESRGAHFRSDHPHTDPALAHPIPFARPVPVLC
jgi:L-aspartate oxidase